MPTTTKTSIAGETEKVDSIETEVLNESTPLDEHAAPEPAVAKRSFLGRWIKRLAIASVLFVGLLAAAVYLTLMLARVEPTFYQDALRVESQEQKKLGSEMETLLIDLRNSIIVSEEWSAQFSEKQINGWLAWDLIEKFPDWLPAEVSDPRIEIGKKNEITIAFKCESKPFKGIGIIKAEIFLTGVINQVGVRFKSVSSGIVPIPVALLADQLSAHAANSDVKTEWTNYEGDPVLLVDLPDSLLEHSGNYVEFKLLEIGKDKVKIAGITHLQDF